jgi:hypothetical protein
MYKLFGSPFDDSTPIAKQRLSVERQNKLALTPSHVDIRSSSIDGMHAEWVEPRQVAGEAVILNLQGWLVHPGAHTKPKGKRERNTKRK